MNTWQEAERVFGRLREVLEEGQPAALAVVVRLEGSGYRRPGARLLIEDSGRMTGNVSGGCLEEDVREVGRRVMRTGKPEIAHYETGTDEDVLWGMGIGCEGKLDVFVRPCSPPGDLEAVRTIATCLQGNETLALATVIDGPAAGRMMAVKGSSIAGGGTADGGLDQAVLARAGELIGARKSALEPFGSCRLFIEVLEVPPDLVVCGAGDDAIPLATYAAAMGFRVTVVDHRPAYLTRERFPAPARLVTARAEEEAELPAGPDTYVVVKTRLVAHDTAWLRRFAATAVPYIGLLGARARREKIVAGLSEEQRRRVYGPVGLDLGAAGPEQVSLSIVAEVLAVRTGREPRHLREREKPIHA